MKTSLLDLIQDGLVDIKTAVLVGKYDKAKEIADRLLQITYKYEVGKYLNDMEVEK